MTVELERLLTPEVYERLRAEAERQNTPVESLVREAIEGYVGQLDDEVEIENMSDEEILENFREGWRDIKEGRTVPAEEALVRLREKWANERD